MAQPDSVPILNEILPQTTGGSLKICELLRTLRKGKNIICLPELSSPTCSRRGCLHEARKKTPNTIRRDEGYMPFALEERSCKVDQTNHASSEEPFSQMACGILTLISGPAVCQTSEL